MLRFILFPLLVSISICASTQITDCGVETQNVSCFGGSDGSISLTGALCGGTEPFTYNWQGVDFTSDAAEVSGLLAGVYEVTVTDAVDAEVVLNYEVYEPAELMISCQVEDPIFINEEGSVSCSVTGGVSPYLFDSELENDLFNSAYVELYEGDYSGTIIDDNGCSAAYEFSLTEDEILNGDLNLDGQLTIVDLTLFLPLYGVVCECRQDFTADGLVTVQDLTLLLSFMD